MAAITVPSSMDESKEEKVSQPRVSLSSKRSKIEIRVEDPYQLFPLVRKDEVSLQIVGAHEDQVDQSVTTALRRYLFSHGFSWRPCVSYISGNGPITSTDIKKSLELLPVHMPWTVEKQLIERARRNTDKCCGCSLLSNRHQWVLDLAKPQFCYRCTVRFSLILESKPNPTRNRRLVGKVHPVTTDDVIWHLDFFNTFPTTTTSSSQEWIIVSIRNTDQTVVEIKKQEIKESKLVSVQVLEWKDTTGDLYVVGKTITTPPPRFSARVPLTEVSGYHYLVIHGVALLGSKHSRETHAFIPVANAAATYIYDVSVDAKQAKTCDPLVIRKIRSVCPRRVFDTDVEDLVVQRSEACIGCHKCILEAEKKAKPELIRVTPRRGVSRLHFGLTVSTLDPRRVLHDALETLLAKLAHVLADLPPLPTDSASASPRSAAESFYKKKKEEDKTWMRWGGSRNDRLFIRGENVTLGNLIRKQIIKNRAEIKACTYRWDKDTNELELLVMTKKPNRQLVAVQTALQDLIQLYKDIYSGVSELPSLYLRSDKPPLFVNIT